MSNYDAAQLDKLLRKKLALDGMGKNPPPQLQPKAIAEKFGLTKQEVINRLRELNRT